MGIDPDHPDRADAATVHLIREAESQGHCFLPQGELIERAQNLKCPMSRPAKPYSGSLCPENCSCIQRSMSNECTLLAGIGTGRTNGEHDCGLWMPPTATPQRPIRPFCERLKNNPSISLNDNQRRAVLMALTHGVTVITGGPGTGKTTIVKLLIKMAQAREENWYWQPQQGVHLVDWLKPQIPVPRQFTVCWSSTAALDISNARHRIQSRQMAY